MDARIAQSKLKINGDIDDGKLAKAPYTFRLVSCSCADNADLCDRIESGSLSFHRSYMDHFSCIHRDSPNSL